MQLVRLVRPIALVLTTACCAPSYLREVDVPAVDFHGRIVDGTTGQPIEGAIVVATWNMYALSVLPEHGPKTTLQDVTETVTDAQGKFVIPNLGVNSPPLGWRPAPGAYPRFMAFKSGYATRFWNQNQAICQTMSWTLVCIRRVPT
jgi:hypothetical protein